MTRSHGPMCVSRPTPSRIKSGHGKGKPASRTWLLARSKPKSGSPQWHGPPLASRNTDARCLRCWLQIYCWAFGRLSRILRIRRAGRECWLLMMPSCRGGLGHLRRILGFHRESVVWPGLLLASSILTVRLRSRRGSGESSWWLLPMTTVGSTLSQF